MSARRRGAVRRTYALARAGGGAVVLAAALFAMPAAFGQGTGANKKGSEIELDKLNRSGQQKPSGDLFGPRSWQPPRAAPKPPPPPPPPPPPQAPPLPFAYMGRWIENGATIVYLQRQNQNYVVRQGDTLDGVYRVESIDDNAMVLTYLPLGKRQVFAFTGRAIAATGAPRSPAGRPAPQQDPPDEED
jgi:hypothetical protein